MTCFALLLFRGSEESNFLGAHRKEVAVTSHAAALGLNLSASQKIMLTCRAFSQPCLNNRLVEL